MVESNKYKKRNQYNFIPLISYLVVFSCGLLMWAYIIKLIYRAYFKG